MTLSLSIRAGVVVLRGLALIPIRFDLDFSPAILFTLRAVTAVVRHTEASESEALLTRTKVCQRNIL